MIAGHYRLVERIGSGGTGVVWRAVDERLERPVAIKQIFTQPSLPAGEQEIVRQRASREARNAARFQHPNAIVVFDITDHHGDPCLIMEYLPSQSLAAVLSSQGPLPLPQVARIGEQVASALVAAHRAGIVHRDVKPGNVLLAENNTVKITDFGISKAKGDVSLTATGLISGTAAYLAPEVARGVEPTPASDVFALGATLFHALEGEPPYGSNPNPLALLYAAANGQLKPTRNAGPLTDLLLSLLSFEPEDRPSMTDVRDELADFAEFGDGTEATRMLSAERPAVRRPTNTMDRRSAHADISTSEMMASAATISEPDMAPVRPAPPGSPPTRSHRVAHGYEAAPSGKRKPVLIGVGVVAGVAVVVAALFLMFSPPKTNSPSPQANSATAGASQQPDAAAGAGAVGQTKSVGKADVNSSIQQVQDFYENLAYRRIPAAWKQLTPAAQQVYGGQEAFEGYWTQNRVTSFNTINSTGSGASADGSQGVSVASVTSGDGSASVTLRLIDPGNGTPLIDSDTRLGQ